MMRLLLVITMTLFALSVAEARSAIIYKNEACSHCGPYIAQLLPVLQANGFESIVQKPFINDPDARAEMANLKERFKVPLQLQGHMSTIIDDKYLLEGHVPIPVVESLLKDNDAPAGLVLIQDAMGEAKDYKALLDGKVTKCEVGVPAGQCAKGGGAIGAAGGFDTNLLVAGAIALVPIGLIVYLRRS